MSAYYNENDPKAAAWLRELIKHGHIAWGEVDERSIEDVKPSELVGYDQCHFFAGIGGWGYALRLAGWPDDRPVWTGSCPCQPFSAAGKGKGFADERHLWPAWFQLIGVCRPSVIFGEQVASPAGLAWFDVVHADLEGAKYACAAADLCAASVGAPHIRQRLYWVAVANGGNASAERLQPLEWLADDESYGWLEERPHGTGSAERAETQGEFGRTAIGGKDSKLGDTSSSRGRRNTGSIPRAEGSATGEVRSQPNELEPSGVLGHAAGERLEGRSVPGSERENERAPWTPSDFVWCRDGKSRPVEPGSFPLAHGVSDRVGLLRGYGNAIVPQLAAAFIEATGLA